MKITSLQQEILDLKSKGGDRSDRIKEIKA